MAKNTVNDTSSRTRVVLRYHCFCYGNEAVIFGKPLKKVQHAYVACLDESQIEFTGLLNILREIDAVFPNQRPRGPDGLFSKDDAHYAKWPFVYRRK